MDIWAKRTDVWNCPACHVENPLDKENCMACVTERPGGSKSNGTPSKGPKKASSEKKPDATEVTPAATTGSIWAKRTDVWSCPDCHVENPLDKDKCMACSAARPSGVKSSDTTETKESNKPSTAGFKFGADTVTSTSTATTSTGAVKSSPFAFGGTSSKATTSSGAMKSSPFAFGGKPASSNKGTTGFTFGAGSSTTPATDSKPAAGATAGFVFGGATAQSGSKPTASGFKFGADTKDSSARPQKRKAEDDDDGPDSKGPEPDDKDEGSEGRTVKRAKRRKQADIEEEKQNQKEKEKEEEEEEEDKDE